MKRFLEKITDTLADAAQLEMGVSVETHAARAGTAEPLMSWFKKFFHNFSVTMADAAHLEIGIPMAAAETKESALSRLFRTATDTLADAAMLEEDIDIFSNYREAEKVLEHQAEQESVHPDECQYGENDLCNRHAA